MGRTFLNPTGPRVALAVWSAKPGGLSYTSFTHHKEEVTLKFEMGDRREREREGGRKSRVRKEKRLLCTR